jgi:hypothetical protein
MAADRSEDSACRHFRRFSPPVYCFLDPDRHRNGSYVTTFANKVNDGPMSLSDLEIFNCERAELGSAQPAAHEHGNHGEITKTAQIVAISFLQQKSNLIVGQPVPRAGTELLCPFYPANSRSELWAEQAGVCSFIS